MNTRPEWLTSQLGLRENPTFEDATRAILADHCARKRRPVRFTPPPTTEPARSRELIMRAAAREGIYICFRPDALRESTARICRLPDDNGAA